MFVSNGSSDRSDLGVEVGEFAAFLFIVATKMSELSVMFVNEG